MSEHQNGSRGILNGREVSHEELKEALAQNLSEVQRRNAEIRSGIIIATIVCAICGILSGTIVYLYIRAGWPFLPCLAFESIAIAGLLYNLVGGVLSDRRKHLRELLYLRLLIHAITVPCWLYMTVPPEVYHR